MSIAEKIKSSRKKLNLSQSQAAKAWGVNVRTLQTWEQGQREPRGLALSALENIIKQSSAKKVANIGSSNRKGQGRS